MGGDLVQAHLSAAAIVSFALIMPVRRPLSHADALAVARANAERLGLAVRFVESDWFGALAGERFDLIVCNPPYVNQKTMARLPPEYRAEPVMALAGGQDGLDFVRRVLEQARVHLTERGLLIMEIGHNREALEQTFPRLPFIWLETSGGGDLVFLLGAEDLPL